MTKLVRLVLTLLIGTFPTAALAQDSSTQDAVSREPQAVAILTQALVVAGASAQNAQDFRATGTITYYWAGEEVKGPVTVRSRGGDQFRLDASLPEGTRSWAVSNESGSVKEMDGTKVSIPSFTALNSSALLRPAARVAAALSDSSFSVSLAEPEQVDGRSAFKVRLRPVIPAKDDPGGHIAHLRTFDVLVDASTFLILRLEDVLQAESIQETYPRELTFADYQLVEGALVPMSITQRFGGQRTWSLRIETVEATPDLTDKDFEL